MKFLKGNIIKNPKFVKGEKQPRDKSLKIFLRSGLIYLTRIHTILKKTH